MHHLPQFLLFLRLASDSRFFRLPRFLFGLHDQWRRSFSSSSSSISISCRLPVFRSSLQFGQNVFLVGSEAGLLGGWNPDGAVSLQWTEGNVWVGEVKIPRGKHAETGQRENIKRRQSDLRQARLLQ